MATDEIEAKAYCDVSEDDDNVYCVVCGEEYPEDCDGIMRCEACEEYYCQTCSLPAEYKRTHRKPIDEELEDYDDWVCDWCKWDVTWNDKEVKDAIAKYNPSMAKRISEKNDAFSVDSKGECVVKK